MLRYIHLLRKKEKKEKKKERGREREREINNLILDESTKQKSILNGNSKES